MGHYLETLFLDLRFGIRMMVKKPTFTVIIVTTLALGIGANTAIFSVTDALMLRKLPARSPEQLVTFEQVFPDGRRQYNFSFPDFERFQNFAHPFSDLAATTWFDRYNAVVNGPGGGLNEGLVRISLVTGNYFSMLGSNPFMGRALVEDDDRLQGAHPVTVISYGYWERAFGLASDVVGRTLTLNGTTYSVIGVMPRGFFGD